MPRLSGSLFAEPIALVLLLSGSARAQPEAGVTLRWSGSGECAKPAHMEADIVALLPPGTALEPASVFEVQIEPLPDASYQLQLRVPNQGVASVRVLRSCAEAAEAAAVMIAMALDADARTTPSAAAPAPEPARDASRDDPLAGDAEPARARGAWALTAAALGDVRSLPEPSVGVMLGAVWSVRALRLAWYGRYLPAQPVDGLPSAASVKLDLYAVALNSAVFWTAGAFEFGPAVELELGYLRGRAEGVPDARSDGAAWAVLAGGAQAEVRLHPRVALQFGALLGVPLWRPRFAFEQVSPFYTSEALVLRWFLGVGFRVGPTG